MVSTTDEKYAGGIEVGEPNGLGALKMKVKESYGEFKRWREHGYCTVTDLTKQS